MSVRMGAVVVIALRVGLAPAVSGAEPAGASSEAVFGFSDESGFRLLVEEAPADPARITQAVCQGGAERTVRFEKRQAAGPDDSGRALASNFASRAGAVFRIEGPPIPVGANAWAGVTCLLTTSAQLQGVKLAVPAIPAQDQRACAPADQAALRSAKRREIVRCVVLAKLGDTPVLLSEWVPQDEQMLASLVVLAEGRPAFVDFEAKPDRERTTCWRVDDGCELEPDALRLPLAWRGAGRLELVLLWSGPEGESASLLRLDGSRLAEIASGYRYWAPQ